MSTSAEPNDTPSLVFISYSSQDREAIGPVVDLVRAMRPGLVFQDYLSLVPGERWHDRVLEAIAEAGTMMVFWCGHSAASENVREEYELGIASDKKVIPLRLDDTEPPPALTRYHWIDFRRPEPHGGLRRFVPTPFRRSGRHFHPTDEFGEYRDWEGEEHAEREAKRLEEWEAEQAGRRREIAAALAECLPERSP